MKKDKNLKKDTRAKVKVALTLEANSLANEWNRTLDPGIRDQWYKCIHKMLDKKPVDLFYKY